MGVTNRRNKQEVPVESKTAMGAPGLDVPKQSGRPVGTMPKSGIQSDKIKRQVVKTTPGVASLAGKSAPVPQQTALGASSAAPNRKNSEVFKLNQEKWRNVLSKYGIKDLM